MREAIGEALLLNLIIGIVIVVALMFIGSISYSKAFKLKNRIINIIEEHHGYTADAIDEINAILSDVGYQVSNGISGCVEKKNNAQTSTKLHPNEYNTKGYNYCVVLYNDAKGKAYYGVTTFMKFELPIIGDTLGILEFPVYGETKTFGILD